MRFRNQQKASKIPTIDLIPMLTVMMGVLGFFVVISTLIAAPPDRVEVTVPDDTEQKEVAAPKDLKPLIIRLQGETQANVDGETLDQAQVLDKITEFISSNDEAPIVLVSEPQIPYDLVVKWLTAMRDAGGERVSLGIDPGGGTGSGGTAVSDNAAESDTNNEDATTETTPATTPAASSGGDLSNISAEDLFGGVEIQDSGIRDSDDD